MKNGNAASYLYGFYRKEKAWLSPGADRKKRRKEEVELNRFSSGQNWF